MDIRTFVDQAMQAQAQSDADLYPRMADVMDKFGYDWEAHKVHTDDQYILTTFHILGKTGQESAAESKGSVLVNHGDLEDGAFWMSQFGEGTPFHLLLVDEGYDVWITNNRGTEYSWDHETLSSKDDNEYWLWTWADMGLYDDVANIKMVKEETGVDKVFYVGYSQGTIQMFYGLVNLESSFHAENVHKVVQLAPCFYPTIDPAVDNLDIINATNMTYQDNGIFAYNGPNWDRDLETVCADYSLFICAYAHSINGCMGQAVQSENYWTMNSYVKRFQEYIPKDEWLAGKHESDLVMLENIQQVPIAMFTATDDHTCPYATALEHIPRIGSETTRIDVDGVDHDYFHTDANSEWFMSNLVAQLQVPEQVTTE